MTEPTNVPAPAEQAETDDRSKRLTPREYARAKTMWVSGDYSLQEISDQVGVGITSLSRRFKRDNLKKGADSDKVSAAVKKAIERSSAAQAEELASAAHDIKMQALKALKLFNQKAYADVAQSIQKNTKLAEVLNDLKALKVASEIVSTNYGTGARILGLDKDLNPDDVLPELHIQLMTENDVQELREAQRLEELMENGELEDDDLADTDLTGGLSDEELDEIDAAIATSAEGEAGEAD